MEGETHNAHPSRAFYREGVREVPRVGAWSWISQGSACQVFGSEDTGKFYLAPLVRLYVDVDPLVAKLSFILSFPRANIRSSMSIFKI